jgi:hypothetical protein
MPPFETFSFDTASKGTGWDIGILKDIGVLGYWDIKRYWGIGILKDIGVLGYWDIDTSINIPISF